MIPKAQSVLAGYSRRWQKWQEWQVFQLGKNFSAPLSLFFLIAKNLPKLPQVPPWVLKSRSGLLQSGRIGQNGLMQRISIRSSPPTIPTPAKFCMV